MVKKLTKHTSLHTINNLKGIDTPRRAIDAASLRPPVNSAQGANKLKILKYLKKKDWAFLGVGVLLIVFQVWLEITMPEFTEKLSSGISAGSITMGEVWKNGGLMIACAAGSLAAAIICGWFVSHIAADFAKTLREKLFDKITEFGSEEIGRFTTPSLITRTTNDVVQMQMLVAMGLQVAVRAPVMAIWAICKISASDIRWTAAVIITVAAIVVMLALIVGLCYPKFKKIQKLTDDLNDITRENIGGVRVIRAYNAEGYREGKFEKVNTAVTKNNLFTARTMGFLMPVMTLCMSGLSLAIYWIAAVLMNDLQGASAMVERAQIIGDMAAFSQYALQVVGAFMTLIMIFIVLPRTMVSAKRINEVLDTVPAIRYPSEDPSTDTAGVVEFKNVAFGFPGGGENCIENISFKVGRGETFAIVGATGSGKTALVNLIPRFYDATEGEVLLDGVNVKEFTKETLGSKISIAPQKAVLFKGDVKSNVTYGAKEEPADDDPRLARALSVAKAAFVYDLEAGIHAEVAQGGTNFSGGQKQRLSIARAVYKDAEVVIFDDTFSALDFKTDMLVRRAIKQELKDTTVIIVAQRIGTIKNADQILVLDGGKSAGLGTHEELLETCPVYREIALSQLSKEEL